MRTNKRVIQLFLWRTPKSNLPETVTPNSKDKLNFRSIYSLHSKRRKAVFKDVISSIHLKGILCFKELALGHSLLPELLC